MKLRFGVGQVGSNMRVGVELIGTGFMGKCHALALAPRLELLCDTPAERAGAIAAQFGFARATGDWRALVADPAVELVSITTPNRLHREMALAALAAGKHVWCEKPLALTLAEAEEMAAAAARAGVVTMVGYNYLRNPAFRHAQALVAAGRIGRPVHFRGWVDEDYQADPELPWTWRAKLSEAGLGTLGDLGCHLVSLAVGLMGQVESLVAETATVHASRPLPDGSGRAAVENEDIARARSSASPAG
jgi:predicted dehydrogenase